MKRNLNIKISQRVDRCYGRFQLSRYYTLSVIQWWASSNRWWRPTRNIRLLFKGWTQSTITRRKNTPNKHIHITLKKMKANPKHIVQASGHGWPRAKDVFPRRFKRPHELCSHFLCVHVVTPPGTDKKKWPQLPRLHRTSKNSKLILFLFHIWLFFFLPLLFLRLSASSICDSTRKKIGPMDSSTTCALVHSIYWLECKALVVKEMAHLKNSTLAYREKPIRSVLAIGELLRRASTIFHKIWLDSFIWTEMATSPFFFFFSASNNQGQSKRRSWKFFPCAWQSKHLKKRARPPKRKFVRLLKVVKQKTSSIRASGWFNKMGDGCKHFSRCAFSRRRRRKKWDLQSFQRDG